MYRSRLASLTEEVCIASTKSNKKMLEEVARSPAIDKESAERNDKGQPAPDVFGSRSSRGTDAKPPGIPRCFRNRHLLPALVSRSAPQRARPTARLPVGIIFYLVSITLVATATIGVFFGVGFFLLVDSAEGMIPSAGRTHSSDLNPPSFIVMSRFLGRPVSQYANPTPVPVAVGPPGPAAVAALPPVPLSQPPLPDQQGTTDKNDAGPPSVTVDRSAGASQDAPSGGNGLETSEAAAAPPAPPSGPAAPPPPAVAEAMPASPRLVLSAVEIEELLTRGDTFLRMGDVTSARLFYERAANAGDGEGAMRMGATFDPTFLGRAGLGGARGDPAKAQSWYRRAIDLSGGQIKQRPSAQETR
jgi:hypothetical protein